MVFDHIVKGTSLTDSEKREEEKRRREERAAPVALSSLLDYSSLTD